MALSLWGISSYVIVLQTETDGIKAFGDISLNQPKFVAKHGTNKLNVSFSTDLIVPDNIKILLMIKNV